MFWKAQPIHVIDFEGSPRYGVVEFGVATLFGGEIVQTHTGICRPSEAMTQREISLHGLGRPQTAHAKPFAVYRELFVTLRQGGAFAAHHASVENALLKQAWAYPPLSPDFSADAATVAQAAALLPQVADWGPWVDSRALYAEIYPQLEKFSLGDLVATFGLEQLLQELAQEYCPPSRRKPHCALFDALASALLLLRLGGEEGFDGLTLPWLIAHSAASAQTRNDRLQQELF